MLALVPVDGSSIGNQPLLERLKSPLSQLGEDAFWAARDELIEKGLLQKACVEGLCCERSRLQALSMVSERLASAAVEEAPPVWPMPQPLSAKSGWSRHGLPSALKLSRKLSGLLPTSYSPILAVIKLGYYNTERPHAFNGGIALALEGERFKLVPGGKLTNIRVDTE